MPLDLQTELMKRVALEQPLQSTQVVQQDSKPSKIPAITYLGGAAADMGTTLFNQFSKGYEEKNKLLKWAPPNARLPIGVGMEGLGMYLAKKLLSKNHPKLYKAGLIGAGLLHGGFALDNIANYRNDPSNSNAGNK